MAALLTPTDLLVTASILLLLSMSTVATDTECKGLLNLTAEASLFSDNYVISPNYLQINPSQIDCELHISTDYNSSIITVDLEYFQMDEGESNCTDNMTVYDGPSTNSPVLRLLCGKIDEVTFNGNYSSMTIVFHSNGLKNNTGFRFQYYAAPKPEDPSEQCHSGILQATESSSNLTSPNYPNNYPSHLNCWWIITAASNSSLIAFNLLSFDIEGFRPLCTSDNVTLYDGNSTSSAPIATLCGVISREHGQYKSTGPYLTVVFHSASYSSNIGFNIGYKSLVKSVICPNTTLLANTVEKYITSPDYPSIYPSNMDCQWIIRAEDGLDVVALNLLDFDLPAGGSTNCSNDYVAIYDGYGKDSPRKYLLCDYISRGFYFSSGPIITVVFHSDADMNYLTGFNFTYSAKDKSDVCSKAVLSATAAAQNFTSPGYPKNYPILMYCQWDITAAHPWEVVVLKPLDFHVDEYLSGCNDDYVIINESSSGPPSSYKICGENPNDKYISAGPLMTVMFRSNSYGSYKGFNFEYTSQRKTVFCARETPHATSTVASLASHDYPSPYPITMDCQWNIWADPFYTNVDNSAHKVVLELNTFFLAGDTATCLSDYVKIFDGPNTTSPEIATLCGQHSNGTFTSTRSHMTIVFHSEGGNNNTKGFSFNYHAKSNADFMATAQITFISLIILVFQCRVQFYSGMGRSPSESNGKLLTYNAKRITIQPIRLESDKQRSEKVALKEI